MIFQTSFLQALTGLAISQFSFGSCHPLRGSTASGNYSVVVVQDLPLNPSQENLALRHTGDIITTSTTSSSLFYVPVNNATGPLLIHDFTSAFGLLGIVELEQDVFYVVASNISGIAVAPGSNGVWKVDMRPFSVANGAVSQPANISLVTMIPEAISMNGMCRLAPNDTSRLLISDSAAGTVTRLDVDTGSYKIVAEDGTMGNTDPTALQVSIDGVHVFGEELFYTNLNQGIFAKIPISLSTGVPTGPAEIIVNGTIFADDFVISRDGSTAWIAMNGLYTLVEVDIYGKQARIVADSTRLQSISAVAYGRTPLDENSLYITGAANVTDGNGTTEGRITRVDLPF